MALKHLSTKLCEYMITSIDGKITLAGTFTNLAILSFPHMQQMGIAVEFTGDNNDQFKVSIEGDAESGVNMTLAEGRLHMPPKRTPIEQSNAIISGSAVITFNRPGIYHVILRSGDTIVHDYPFGMIEAQPYVVTPGGR